MVRVKRRSHRTVIPVSGRTWKGQVALITLGLLKDSWHRPEALSPSRVLCTPHSRITKGPLTSPGMPEGPQSMFSLVAKTELSVFGIPAWVQKSRPTRPTVMKFSQSLCECIGTNHERVCANSARSLVSAHTITPSSYLLGETDRSFSGTSQPEILFAGYRPTWLKLM
jgi:hypothetical protein